MYAPAGLASMIHGPRISSLVPTLPSGVRFATTCTGGKSCRAFGSEAVGAGREVISVGNVPGRIVLTRMCSLGVSPCPLDQEWSEGMSSRREAARKHLAEVQRCG